MGKKEDVIIEQRAVLNILIRKHKSNGEIIEQLSSVYGAHAVAKLIVKNWVKCFRAGQTSLQDDHREGRPATVVDTILREQLKK